MPELYAEIEAALLQFFRKSFAHGRLGRNLLHRLEAVDLGLAFDMLPDQLAEATGFLVHDLAP